MSIMTPSAEADEFFGASQPNNRAMGQPASTTTNFAEKLQEDKPGTRDSLDHTPTRKTPFISSKTSLISEPTSSTNSNIGGNNTTRPPVAAQQIKTVIQKPSHVPNPINMDVSAVAQQTPDYDLMSGGSPTKHGELRSPAKILGLADNRDAVKNQRLPESRNTGLQHAVPFNNYGDQQGGVKFDLPKKEELREITGMEFHPQLGPPFLPHQTKQRELEWGPECFDKEFGCPFPPNFFDGRTTKTKPVWHDFFGPPIRKGGAGAQRPEPGSKPKSSQSAIKPLLQPGQGQPSHLMYNNGQNFNNNMMSVNNQATNQFGAQQLHQQQTPQHQHMQQVQQAQQQQAMQNMLQLNRNNNNNATSSNQQQFPPNVIEFAKYITINPETEAHLLPLAAQCLQVPLPPVWRPVRDPSSGRTYFVHMQTQQTSWDHPLKADFVKKVDEERKKGPPAAAANNNKSDDSNNKPSSSPQQEYKAPDLKQNDDLDELLGNNKDSSGKTATKDNNSKKPHKSTTAATAAAAAASSPSAAIPKPTQAVNATSPEAMAKQNARQQEKDQTATNDSGKKHEPFLDDSDDDFFKSNISNNNNKDNSATAGGGVKLEVTKKEDPAAASAPKKEASAVVFDDL